MSVLFDAFKLPPVEAIRYLRAKGAEATWNWYDMWREQHARAFTVAKATRMDVLQSIRTEVDRAISEGITLRQFQKDLQPRLESMGWWGKLADDSGKVIQLGSPRRLRTIFQSNVQTAYMAGRYQGAKAVAGRRPWWQYIATLDGATRPAHRALHSKVFRYDDPFWDSHMPPNGWGCRCRFRTLADKDLVRLGLTPESGGEVVTREVMVGSGESARMVKVRGYRTTTGDGQPITVWPDAGWDYNPGKAAFAIDERKYSPAIVAAAKKARRKPTQQSAEVKAPRLLDEFPIKKYDDIAPLLAAYSERHPEVMRNGFKGLKFDRARYFMATNCRGRIWISGMPQPHLNGFNAKSDLRSALIKLTRGKGLTFNEEYAIEGLWHEMLHNRATGHLGFRGGSVYETIVETVNQFIARHTYPEFMGHLGAVPRHHAAVLAKGYGYRKWVPNLRRLISHLGVSEDRALAALKEVSWTVHWGEQPRRVAETLARLAGDTSEAFVGKMMQSLERLRRYPNEDDYADVLTSLIGQRRALQP